MSAGLLRLEGLSKRYRRGGVVVRALDGVDLVLGAGEALAVVGASGSGKSTLARCMLRIEAIDEGRLVVAGRDWTRAKPRELVGLWKIAQMVFQAPLGAFDPLWQVGAAVAEPLRHLRPELKASARRREVQRLFELVELDPALAGRLPHELSGGQLQRVAIARALAPRPRLLVADEPTSALDTVTQRRILQLMAQLRQSEHLALIWVTHDLALLPHICEQMVVMEQGQVVERLSISQLATAKHPCTRALRDAADIASIER